MKQNSEKQVRLDIDTWKKLKIMSVNEDRTMRDIIKELINDKESNNK